MNLKTLLFLGDDLTYSILCIPISFLTCFFCTKLCCQTLNIETTKAKELLHTLFFGILLALAKIFIPIQYYRLFSLFIFPVLLYFIFKIDLIRGLLSNLIMFITVVIIDIIFSSLYCKLYRIDNFKTGFTIPIFKITLIFTMMLTYMITYFYIKRTKLRIKLNTNITKKEQCKILFLTSLGLIILSIQLWESIYFLYEFPIFITLNDILSMLIYYNLGISNIKKIIHINKSHSNITALRNYNKNLKKINDDILSFKHDFNNIIQSIGGYIVKEDLNGLKEYYKQISNDCNCLNNLESLNPLTINNPAIYNIINQKVNISQKYGIQTNLYISLDLNSINMKIYEMTRILGILLDNAIEASKECETKIININFSLNNSKNMQIIKIENTYIEKNIDLDKIFEKSYSTKSGNTGLGLWKVRKILSKSNNPNLHTTKNSEFFCQQLEIYV